MIPPSRSPRARDLRRALRDLAPRIPLADAEPVLEAAERRAMRALTPATAIWLVLVARIRHTLTEYDALLADGYDRDAARHFTLDATNEALALWGCARRLDPDDADAPDLAEDAPSP